MQECNSRQIGPHTAYTTFLTTSTLFTSFIAIIDQLLLIVDCKCTCPPFQELGFSFFLDVEFRTDIKILQKLHLNEKLIEFDEKRNMESIDANCPMGQKCNETEL